MGKPSIFVPIILNFFLGALGRKLNEPGLPQGPEVEEPR